MFSARPYIGTGTMTLLIATIIGLATLVAGCGGGGGGGGGGTPPTGTVVGRVVDLQGSPVADARVTVKGTGLVATTNGIGQYHLSNVPAGWQTLQATKAGMVTAAGLHIDRSSDKLSSVVKLRTNSARVTGNAQAVAEVRVFVQPDETVTAPDLLLTPEGWGNTDSVVLLQVTPVPGTMLEPNDTVSISVVVKYLLSSAANGVVKIFLTDETGYYLLDPAETAEAVIGKGEGTVSLEQTIRVPRAIEEIQLLVALFPGTSTASSTYTFGKPYPVRSTMIYLPGMYFRNGVAHPERHEIYAVGTELYVIDTDTLTYRATNIQASPQSMLLSPDGNTLYLASTGKVLLYYPSNGRVQTFAVEPYDVFAVVPVTGTKLAYFYRVPTAEFEDPKVCGGLLDIETGQHELWGEDLGDIVSVNSNPSLESVYTVAKYGKPVQKWVYDGNTLRLAQTSRVTIFVEDRILADHINNLIYVAGAKVDARDINWVYDHVSDKWSGHPVFIALSPDGRWVADKNTIYETEHLIPFAKLPQSPWWLTFGADGLLWAYDGTIMKAWPFRGGDL